MPKRPETRPNDEDSIAHRAPDAAYQSSGEGAGQHAHIPETGSSPGQHDTAHGAPASHEPRVSLDEPKEIAADKAAEVAAMEAETREILARFGDNAPVVNFTDRPITPEAIREFNWALRRLADDYPGIIGEVELLRSVDFEALIPELPEFWHANAATAGKNIYINWRNYRDNSWRQAAMEDIASNHYAPGAGFPSGILTHEVAHIIGDKILADPAMAAEMQKAISSALDTSIYRYGYNPLNPRHPLDVWVAVKSHLGEYGATDPAELISEAFAEYRLAMRPRGLARAVGSVIDRHFHVDNRRPELPSATPRREPLPAATLVSQVPDSPARNPVTSSRPQQPLDRSDSPEPSPSAFTPNPSSERPSAAAPRAADPAEPPAGAPAPPVRPSPGEGPEWWAVDPERSGPSSKPHVAPPAGTPEPPAVAPEPPARTPSGEGVPPAGVPAAPVRPPSGEGPDWWTVHRERPSWADDPTNSSGVWEAGEPVNRDRGRLGRLGQLFRPSFVADLPPRFEGFEDLLHQRAHHLGIDISPMRESAPAIPWEKPPPVALERNSPNDPGTRTLYMRIPGMGRIFSGSLQKAIRRNLENLTEPIDVLVIDGRHSFQDPGVIVQALERSRFELGSRHSAPGRPWLIEVYDGEDTSVTQTFDQTDLKYHFPYSSS